MAQKWKLSFDGLWLSDIVRFTRQELLIYADIVLKEINIALKLTAS